MATDPMSTTPIPDENGSYTGENIKILEGLEAVRLRPAMYIGSTGEMGLHHLVYEVVDNSVDEALAGYGKKIDVVIHVDNSITVVDDGRGIPVDMMDLSNGKKMPAVQVVLTKLHAGGKFGQTVGEPLIVGQAAQQVSASAGLVHGQLVAGHVGSLQFVDLLVNGIAHLRRRVPRQRNRVEDEESRILVAGIGTYARGLGGDLLIADQAAVETRME